MQDTQSILNFLHVIHHIKRIERFKNMPFWKEAKVKRWDSTAEHTFRMALIAVLIIPYLKKEYSLEKLLKMILIHDLVEVIIDDKFPFKSENGNYTLPTNYTPDDPAQEKEAFKTLIKDLPPSEQEEFIILFNEFVDVETGKGPGSSEAQLAVALDRLEATLQVIDYIKLDEFISSNEHKELQTKYLKSKADIGEDSLNELVELIGKEIRG